MIKPSSKKFGSALFQSERKTGVGSKLSANVKSLRFSEKKFEQAKPSINCGCKMSRDLFRRVLMTPLGAKSQRVSFPRNLINWTFSAINWTLLLHNLDAFTDMFTSTAAEMVQFKFS